MKENTIYITSFRPLGSNRIDWIVIDCITGEPTHYHTDNAGHGAWIGEDFYKQVIGSCDFQLKQKYRKSVLQAIKKEFA